ncbi:hypothetical protein TRFO_39563 [Tritrichomonas foetus]|uniref:Uncharacterized protein n=1 Tax=Tritrichomonas foetus TaxID=1144522 RepID=A0A1J4J989_9EUKA|nr:hypothetical protein TRFO_39563 [Tritrichomonas foetus]|eukprot:OHS94251.1 hypothetical protein TRFO_39563 [Tritrichomonas foetus]
MYEFVSSITSIFIPLCRSPYKMFFFCFFCLMKSDPLLYIPKEFQELRNKAVMSSVHRIKNNKIHHDNVYMPGRPIISQTLNATFAHPVFGVTVDALRGYAITKTKSHVAIIANRNDDDGMKIIEEKSIFVTEVESQVFSLNQKFADDGEVAIFNISEMNILEIFDIFEMKLPAKAPVDLKCEHFGKHFGGRCSANGEINWDNKNNVPMKVTIPGVPKETNKYADLYAGITANAQASVIIKKVGPASLQEELDSSLDIIGGAGIHLSSIKTEKDLINIPINQKEFKIVGSSINIFTQKLTITASLVARVLINQMRFEIKHEVSILKRFKLHLQKGLTITSKHCASDDLAKSFVIEDVSEDGTLISEDTETNLQAEFDANFSIQAGVRINLTFGSMVDAYLEAGAKSGFHVKFGVDTEKCTFPSLYGSFTPFISSYIEGGGSLTVLNWNIFDFDKHLSKDIWRKELIPKICLFDADSSDEKDKDLIQEPERLRTVVSLNDLSYDSDVDNYTVVMLFVNSNEEYQEKVIFYKLENNAIIDHYPLAIMKREFDTPSTMLYLSVNQQEIPSFQFDWDNHEVISNQFNFTLKKSQSTPTKMGKQFSFSAYDEYRNFVPENMHPSTLDPQPISLIIHTKKSGYVTNSKNFYIKDEITDIPKNDIYRWTALKLNATNDKCQDRVIYIYSVKNDIIEQCIKIIASDCENGKMVVNNTKIFLPKYEPANLESYVCFIIYASEKEIIGSLALTINDLQQNTYELSLDDGTKFTFEQLSEPVNVEYIFGLSQNYQETITEIKDEIKGIICRVFEKYEDGERFLYTPSSGLSYSFTMYQNEVYGNLRFLFQDPGYNFEYTYALLDLPGIRPLMKEASCFEGDNLYLIQLIKEKNVFETQESGYYDIVIPFRRINKEEESIPIKLYKIFQSQENNNHDPFCSSFPTFKLAPKNNFHVGCIRSYTSPKDFEDNKWSHYSQTKVQVSSNDYPETIGKESFYRLHSITWREGKVPDKEEIIAAKQSYFNFPLTSRTLTIENETVENINKFTPMNRLVRINCPRCTKINHGITDTEVPFIDGMFQIGIDSSTKSGFSLDALCNTNKSSYCKFEFSLKDDGIVLLEYNTYMNNLLEDSSDIKQTYPGVEEIYDWEKEESSPSQDIIRLDTSIKRQILKNRDKVIATKNWEGEIKKIISNIENQKLTIEISHTQQTKSDDYVIIELKEKTIGSIPFSTKIFYQNDETTFKTCLEELGITISESMKDIIKKKDVYLNEDAQVVVKSNLFSAKKLEEKFQKQEFISLLDIPKDNYLAYYKNQTKKNNLALILGLSIGIPLTITAVVVIVIIVKKHD